ncbi:MAG: lysophospholipid acyltransferase family protein [Candidatus Sulfotelmatobacter sp.]
MTEAGTTETPATEVAAGPNRFTLRQRIILRIIIAAGYWFIGLIGPTLRVCVSREEGAEKTLDERPLITSFWHACIIPATYLFRDFGIRVMSSNSYDGEYMGRIIHKFGFVAVKGSSSRNAVRALLGLRRALQEGWTVAFSIDGPRGPRYKVKPGPVALARSSSVPMSMFHIAVERAWVLNTWDRLIIPKPFSRVLLRFGKLIPVPAEASDEDLERYQQELQDSLDRACEFAEKNVSRVGAMEFPYYDSSAETRLTSTALTR